MLVVHTDIAMKQQKMPFFYCGSMFKLFAPNCSKLNAGVKMNKINSNGQFYINMVSVLYLKNNHFLVSFSDLR